MSRSKSPLHSSYTFYLDECLGGKKVFDVLKEAHLNVELHDQHFKRGTPDEQWLPEIGKRGWVLLTQDKGIRRRANEKMALRLYGVRAFFINAKGLRGDEIGDLIVRALPKILRTLKKTRPPFIALVNRTGIVELKEGKEKYKRL